MYLVWFVWMPKISGHKCLVLLNSWLLPLAWAAFPKSLLGVRLGPADAHVGKWFHIYGWSCQNQPNNWCIKLFVYICISKCWIYTCKIKDLICKFFLLCFATWKLCWLCTQRSLLHKSCWISIKTTCTPFLSRPRCLENFQIFYKLNFIRSAHCTMPHFQYVNSSQGPKMSGFDRMKYILFSQPISMALIEQRLGWCGVCIFSYFTSVYTIALTDFTTKPLKLPFLH